MLNLKKESRRPTQSPGRLARSERVKVGVAAPPTVQGKLGRSVRQVDGSMEPGTPVPKWKRPLDITIVLATAPAWLPIYLIIGLWVKIVSTGPRLFRQERVGYGGRQFTIYKFRSMKVNAETRTHEAYVAKLMQTESPMQKMDDFGDPRIITGGRFLRATGLDELPQIFNVLRGDMSLVGPRPCTPKEFKYYRDSEKERFDALPGLTGYWQVNGKNRTTFAEMVSMDIKYVHEQSLGMDLGIMACTFPTLLSQFFELRKRKREYRVSQGLPSTHTAAIATKLAENTTRIATKISANTADVATKITNGDTNTNTSNIATRG